MDRGSDIPPLLEFDLRLRQPNIDGRCVAISVQPSCHADLVRARRSQGGDAYASHHLRAGDHSRGGPPEALELVRAAEMRRLQWLVTHEGRDVELSPPGLV